MPVLVFQEPQRTGFELTWQMLGVRFRVLPSFFLIAALLAGLFIWPIVGNNLTALAIGIAIDVACIFFAIVFTEFVQGMVYRSYGLRSTVLIQDFGGGIYPDSEPPTALQRIVVALSAPASSFLLLAVVFYSNQEYNWSGAHMYARFAYFILWIISLFWGIIGLLPIFPYPGGKVMFELLNLVSPRNGLVWTLVISIALGIAYIVYTVAVRFMHQMAEIPLIEGVRLPASVILAVFFGIATARNWQLLQMARAMQQRQQPNYRDEYDDDREPWRR
jgi:hypothetical protein